MREEKKPAREGAMREEKKPTREGAMRERKRYMRGRESCMCEEMLRGWLKTLRAGVK